MSSDGQERAAFVHVVRARDRVVRWPDNMRFLNRSACLDDDLSSVLLEGGERLPKRDECDTTSINALACVR
jgi:hypothetical protein